MTGLKIPMTSPHLVTPDTVGAWLGTVEWYDNHRLGTMLECMRKAFWHILYQPPGETRQGLATRVGNGAGFGSAIHAGKAAYYDGWGKRSEPDRRIDAYEAFGRVWAKNFAGVMHENKHSEGNGVSILQDFFDRFLLHDIRYKPIDTEMAIVAPIEPHAGESFDPFYYVCRLDGLWEDLHHGDLLVEETKTTGSGVLREIERLRIARQPTGYVWATREVSGGQRVSGFLANVMLVAATKRDAAREIYTKSNYDLESWRRQTIHIVENWRRLTSYYASSSDPFLVKLDHFLQDDKQCMNYGRCAFYDVCTQGAALAATFPVNTWTPFQVEDVTP